VALVELAPTVLARAVDPFLLPVRTLDALHLSTALFLRDRSQDISLAAFDDRLRRAAAAVGLPLAKV
jgi:predicted nucleic acid-binding protein